MVELTSGALIDLQKEFNLGSDPINLIKQKVKRLPPRILDNYFFTIILDNQSKT